MRVLTTAQWHEDLRFLARELPKRHANAFHHVSRERFETIVAELDRNIDHLNSDEIYVGMNRLTNMIGDGHTYMPSPTDDATFPLKLERFGEEYRVVESTSDYKGALGGRVIEIEGTPITRAREMLFSLTPGDETQVLRDLRVTTLLTRGSVLHGTGIIHDRNTTRYTLANDDGREFNIDTHPIAFRKRSRANWTHVFKEPPLFRQRHGVSFWYAHLRNHDAIYVSFRGYKDLRNHSRQLFRQISRHTPDKLVIDMRLNGGGDYEKGLKYLVHPIRDLSEINRKGHLFVLIGPSTFSAAMSNSAHFRYQTSAILVGQQIGEKPNSYQEARSMKLPNSHWTVQYSVKFYKFVESGENLIRPDKEIIPSWNDYRSGHDPVLEWALSYSAGAGDV
ncbi:MAG TPA: hypothetical protein VGS11_12505 [Candidatus Bathyarchaeia archaeon]|nr:hypothetical protein [Candidatus Bathyarchaeia archaeon]